MGCCRQAPTTISKQRARVRWRGVPAATVAVLALAFGHRLAGGRLVDFAFSCVVVAGFANGLLLAVLWLLYMSFVHVGQEWYGYGWEIQLTKTGVLAIFLGPLLDIRTFPRQAPPLPIVVLFRWLVV